MTQSLEILFISRSGVGHMNACIGLAEVLLESGHRVMFAISGDQWKGKLTEYGFEEVMLSSDSEIGADRQQNKNTIQRMAERLMKRGNISDLSPIEKAGRENSFERQEERINMYISINENVKQLLKTIRPNVIILDQFLPLPSVEASGIPWIWSWSAGPLYATDGELTPPSGSGLSINNDKNDWIDYRNKLDSMISTTIWNKFNAYVVANGGKRLEKHKFRNDSPFLNIYGFPLELDYIDVQPLPPKWYRFDNLKRTEKLSNFEIPIELSHRSGKLVYFSLGSMVSADVELMQRLVAILSKSKHRFIVSKGPLHSTYALADNMFGEESVPQIRVLQKVDLVITHGGTNTVSETFYFGKPMIVLPFFGDQYDNAQRLEDKGLGLRLDPYRCTEDELLNAIEKLLNDKELNEKLQLISKRIQSENSIEKLPKLIEDLVNNN